VPGEAAGAALPIHVAGRVAEDGGWPDGFRHAWPGVVVEAAFSGNWVEVRLVDRVNRWRVTVDETVVELTRPGDGVLRFTGLPEGDHLLRAEKLSESWEDAVFGGVFAEAGRPVEGPGRVFEVYGDSDAVGYGARSDRRDCPGEGVFLNTDSTLAFPALVAEAFGADLELVARSGIGLIRDFSPEQTGGRMIDVANRAAFADGSALSTEGERIIIIALGSNDFDMDLREGEPWSDKAAMIPDFAAALRDFALDRPSGARQVVLVAFGGSGDELVAAHEAAVEGLWLDAFGAELVVVPELSLHGCDWHPDAEDHALVAGLIAAAIADLPAPWTLVDAPEGD
jgi:lysophospholipase L1-like esterase